MLSSLGKRLYFPHGIVSQSQQATEADCQYNATAGVALEDHHYITHPYFSGFSCDISSDQMVKYAPTTGSAELRKLWDAHLMEANPSLKDVSHSLPVVTGGITHALSIAASLFTDESTTVLIPSPCWDNYPLVFEDNRGAHLRHYQMFDEHDCFTVGSWQEQFLSIDSDVIVALFNFPHNPTGFTPDQSQMMQIAGLLKSLALKGKKIVAIVDDAYFGLFHTVDCSPFSLFSYLADLHENILAVKCDGATKESLVWGFRVGFITYANKGLTEAGYEALLEKTKGAVRTSISSASMVSQSLLINVMKSESYPHSVQKVKDIMRRRYERIVNCIAMYDHASRFTMLPANSGYFISLRYEGNAYDLRLSLLKEGIAVIALDEHLIRIAYSSVDDHMIEHIVRKLFEGDCIDGN